jgi:hypothetical protein
VAVLAVLAIAVWALSHRYHGLFHDAGLYALQALARLHPDSLSADVFLKFGSQDRFTVFSPIYAAAVRWLGAESAAAWLTFASQIALLGAAWLLARTIMSGSMALLGVGLLLALPGDYGPGRIFTCIEPFLTPRMAAEALVLCGIAAVLRGKAALCAAALAAAMLLHPIMAMAGPCALYWRYLGERRRSLALWLAAIAAAALILAALVMPPGPLGRFDAEWLTLIERRSPYLFLGFWTMDDFAHAAMVAATLLAAIWLLPAGAARDLCKITLSTCICGIALTLLGCDWLHLAPVTQSQPWRWLWLGTVVSALMLPRVLGVLLGGGRPARTTGLLLLAGWIFGSNPYALSAAAAALASLWGAQRLRCNELRWVHLGAFGLLGIAVLWRLATNLDFTDAHYLDPQLPLWLRRAMSFARDGSAPAALFACIWWLSRQPAPRSSGAPRVRIAMGAGLALAGALSCAACAALAPYCWAGWSARVYSPRLIEQFDTLRRGMPRGSEVFAPESPVEAWVLLERPSYISMLQTSGLVFSRPAAREFERRANALSKVVGPDAFLNWETTGISLNLSPQQLIKACGTGEFEFLVTRIDLDAALPAGGPKSLQRPIPGALRLYRCRAAPG